MHTTNDLQRNLKELVEGDLTHLQTILSTPHVNLLEARKHMTIMCLQKSALVKVLTSLKEHRTSSTQVQQWASLMRRGYVGCNNRSSPIVPMEIDYSTNAENVIVDVLERLDELGDVVEGTLNPTDIDLLLAVCQT